MDGHGADDSRCVLRLIPAGAAEAAKNRRLKPQRRSNNYGKPRKLREAGRCGGAGLWWAAEIGRPAA